MRAWATLSVQRSATLWANKLAHQAHRLAKKWALRLGKPWDSQLGKEWVYQANKLVTK